MTVIRIVLVATAVILLASTPVAATNRYFSDGESGLTLTAAYLSAENADGFSLEAVLTVGSRFDLGLGYSKLSVDLGDADASEISPHVGFAAIRPTAESAFGLDLAAGVSFSDVSSPLFDFLNVDVSGRGYVLGAEGYGRLGRPDQVQVFPALGIAYASVTQTITSGAASEDLTVDDILISFSLTAQFQRVLLLGAGAQVFDDDTTWFIGIGAAISFVEK